MNTRKPRLLDLFCGAGGAATGYHRAGFEVVGVDVKPQPHYPFTFIQADALTFPLDGFDVIHASPPCQDYSSMSNVSAVKGSGKYPRLIRPIRARLVANGAPWIIENVMMAAIDMHNPVMLCGTAFGLRTRRHRLFDSSHLLFAPGPCHHRAGDVSVRTTRCEFSGMPTGVTYVNCRGETQNRWKSCSHHDAQRALGIDWMTRRELGESIPPAYTEFIGLQLLAAIGLAA